MEIVIARSKAITHMTIYQENCEGNSLIRRAVFRHVIHAVI